MVDTTTVNTYAKATNTKAEVEAIAQNRLANGAKSSVVTDDSTNWILTTVWPGEC